MSGRIVSIGECMVELSPAGDGLFRRGFAGDSFNTAWYQRRQLPADWTVAYATAVGTDPLSDEMVAFLAAEGIATEAVAREQARTVGLYMIALKDGERTFSYWRSHSAARLLARDPGRLDAALAGAAVVIATGITVAIVEPEHRGNLVAALARARAAGAAVVFDPNIRPRLWPDAATMRREIERVAAVAGVALPSFDDEHAHFSDPDPAATLARYRALGARTVVVKNGAAPLLGWTASDAWGTGAAGTLGTGASGAWEPPAADPRGMAAGAPGRAAAGPPGPAISRRGGGAASGLADTAGQHGVPAAGQAGDAFEEVRPIPVTVVDTTAAGDSFNAGFLAARLQGASLRDAMIRGAALAGVVVGAPGALVREGTSS